MGVSHSSRFARAPLIIILHVCNAWALSSPSPLRGYHFGTASDGTPKKLTSFDLARKRPKAYVPDGLTEAQYMQIKAEELAQQQKMNFGMWGPRFKQIDGDPDSNWFNFPSLWTGGYSANKMAANSTVDGGVDPPSDAGKKLIVYLRRYGPAYLMLLLSTQFLARSVLSKRVMWSKLPAVRMTLPIVVLKPISAVATFLGRRQIMWLSKSGTTKIACGLSTLMLLLAFVLR